MRDRELLLLRHKGQTGAKQAQTAAGRRAAAGRGKGAYLSSGPWPGSADRLNLEAGLMPTARSPANVLVSDWEWEGRRRHPRWAGAELLPETEPLAL